MYISTFSLLNFVARSIRMILKPNAVAAITAPEKRKDISIQTEKDTSPADYEYEHAVDNINGTVERILYAGNSWSSVLMNVNTGDAKFRMPAVGLPEPAVGMEYVFSGTITKHPKYGWQIKIKTARMKNGASGMFYSFLGNLKGVGGERGINSLRETFGDSITDVIENDPSALTKAKYIGVKQQKNIIKAYKENCSKFVLYENIMNLFTDAITLSKAVKIAEKYGNKAVEIIKNNPYKLADIDGFGFLTVDKLALSAGVEKKSMDRARATVMYILDNEGAQNGHTYLSFDELEEKATEYILPVKRECEALCKDYLKAIRAGEKDRYLEEHQNAVKMLKIFEDEYLSYLRILSDALYAEYNEGNVVIPEIEPGSETYARVYLKKYYDAEKYCCDKINRLLSKPLLPYISIKKAQKRINELAAEGRPLSDEQKNAVEKALNNRVSIITGGAGTGKSTIIDVILSGWTGNVVLMAPTGRASQRLSETTDKPASTIHRKIYDYQAMMAAKMPKGDKNANNTQDDAEKPADYIIPIEEDSLIILDEASMINILLAKDFLKAVRDSHIVFVGDANQLPPIGPGTFFANLLKSVRVPKAVLTHTFRSSGSIDGNARLVNDGRSVSSFINDDKSSFFPVDNNEDIQSVITSMWKEARKTFPVEDVRVLTPTKQRGRACSNEINRIIRELENPYSPASRITCCTKYRTGDRVMQVKNDYKMTEFVEDDQYKTKDKQLSLEGMVEGYASINLAHCKPQKSAVFNGETGTVLCSYEYDGDQGFIVRFDPVGKQDAGRLCFYTGSDVDNLDFAYASTIHKSQGSEYGCVILACTMEHYIMLKRNLLYTGMTRSKKKIYMVGEKRAYHKAINDIDYKDIHCSLAEMLNREREPKIS